MFFSCMSRPQKDNYYMLMPLVGLVGPKNGLVGPIKELSYYTIELTMTMKLKVDCLNV